MDLILNFIQILISGDPKSIILLLIITIIMLLFDRNRLLKSNIEKDKKLEKVIEDYYLSNLKLAEALNNIKNILSDIKTRL